MVSQRGVQYIQTLFRSKQWRKTCLLHHTLCWQWAEVIATTEKGILGDPVEALWKNYKKMTLQRPEFVPSEAT